VPAKLSFGQPSIRHEIIKLNSGGEFKLHLKSPDFAAQCDDWERKPGWVADHLQKSVVGWSDLLDEKGEAVPFSWEAFQSACAAAPEIANQAVAAVLNLYSGTRTETDSKNSASPPEDSSAAATSEPTPK